jgi:hypothetical protein
MNTRTARKAGLLSAAFTAITLFAGTAWGAERAGVQMPDAVSASGQNLVLNGLGVREASMFNVDVYVAGLYLRQRTSDSSQILRPDEPKILQMTFVHDVSRDQMNKAWREGFEKNAGPRVPSLQSRINQLGGWMVDRKKGDTLTFVYLPGRGVEVRVSGVSKGTIPGDDFAEALFSVWLGAHPPNEGLKAGLLGRR